MAWLRRNQPDSPFDKPRPSSATAAIAVARDLVAHPIIVLRAILIGLVLLEAARFPLEWTWDRLRSPFNTTLPYLGLQHQAGIVAGIVRSVLVSPLQFAIGWLVVRANRVRTPITIVSLLAIGWLLAAPELVRLVTNSVDQPRFRPYLAIITFDMIALSISMVAGGLRAIGPTTKCKPVPQ